MNNYYTRFSKMIDLLDRSLLKVYSQEKQIELIRGGFILVSKDFHFREQNDVEKYIRTYDKPIKLIKILPYPLILEIDENNHNEKIIYSYAQYRKKCILSILKQHEYNIVHYNQFGHKNYVMSYDMKSILESLNKF